MTEIERTAHVLNKLSYQDMMEVAGSLSEMVAVDSGREFDKYSKHDWAELLADWAEAVANEIAE